MKMQGGDNMTIGKMGKFKSWFGTTKKVSVGLILLGIIVVLVMAHMFKVLIL